MYRQRADLQQNAGPSKQRRLGWQRQQDVQESPRCRRGACPVRLGLRRPAPGTGHRRMRVNRGLLSRPGKLWAEIAIEEGKVVYNVKAIVFRRAENAAEPAEVQAARLA